MKFSDILNEEKLDNHDLLLIKNTKKILAAGIKPCDYKEATRLGGEAANEINGRTKVGYTVYSSHYNGITGNNDDLKSITFAGVGGYNNNAKTSKLNNDANFLKQNGWKTVVINDSDFGGIVVSKG